MSEHNLPQPKQAEVSADVKYACYVDIYTTVDSLMWRNMTTLLGVTILGAGIMGTLLGHDEIAIIRFTHNQTVGCAFLLIAVFYGVTIHVLRRMRFHHELLEIELRELESSGYFHRRKESVSKWWLAAPTWVQIAFAMLMVLCFIASLFYLTGDGYVCG